MPRKSTLPPDAPVWVTEDRRIDEMTFCCSFLEAHPMKCVHGKLYTVDGLISDEAALKREIFMEICDWVKSGTARKVEDLLKAVKMMAFADEIPLHQDRIHVANGTWHLDGHFSEEKEYCRNRLDVAYNLAAGTPNVWLNFLSELLVPEDIPTLQEYLGYCLLPTTKAQKMLLMIGKGGEGKSRIGLVMRSILGINMNTTSIQKVETNRFARADLEDKLLMVDDDMDMSALTKTNYIKSIVTSECQMDVERKGIQSYQSLLYVRFLCFGNGALTALHDRSDGFFRRQIVITTKDKPEGRIDDPYLVEKMIAEKEGIFLWCLEGLKRLVANDYRFTIIDRSREKLEGLLLEVNAFNAKAKAAEIGKVLDKYIPNVEKMSTQIRKYSKAFGEMKAENAALETANEALTAELKESRQESVLKKMADLQLRRDYDAAVAFLERIPPEVLEAYAYDDQNERNKTKGRDADVRE